MLISINQLKRIYNKNSVSICGKKGKGKDMLTANIIARRRSRYYISNVDYKLKNKVYIPFVPQKIKTNNTYRNFIDGDTKAYYYPYPDNADIYISDCGIYFPSQYNGELNRDYKDIPVFMALSRQLGNCFVHTNSQALNRVWDKIREQSDIYISCQECYVIGKLVIQNIRIYERYESACDNVPPFSLKCPLNAERRQKYEIEKQRYHIQYGKIKSCTLIYFNKSKYDTRLFKTLLETERGL